MANKYEELVNVIEQKKSEIDSITAEMEDKKQKYEIWIERMKGTLQDANNEYSSMLESYISVKLSDLLTELFTLTNINYFNSNIEVRTNIWLEEGEDMNSQSVKNRAEYNNLEIVMKGNDENMPFFYVISVPLDFDRVQADGKTLLEHCSLKAEEQDDEFSSGENLYQIVVDKNIGNLICDFKLSDVISGKIGGIGMSKVALKQAIINSYEKYSNSLEDMAQ